MDPLCQYSCGKLSPGSGVGPNELVDLERKYVPMEFVFSAIDPYFQGHNPLGNVSDLTMAVVSVSPPQFDSLELTFLRSKMRF